MLPTMHIYDPIHNHELGVEKGSSEESLLSARENQTTSQQTSLRWRNFFYTLSVLVLVTFMFLIFRALAVVSTQSPIQRTPIPEFANQIYLIHPDDVYEAPASPESDALWDSVLPGGKGFVLVEEPERFGLPPGLPSPNNGTKTYGVTWTHEYHCLKLIREEFWNAIYGSSKLYGGYEANPPLSTENARRLHHIQHCMNYIRQLVVCRADMTIEWAAPYPDALGNKNHIDGYNIPHQCTNWDDMYDYMMNAQPWPKDHYAHHDH